VKKLLVLSDNDKLFRTLELNLQGHWQATRCQELSRDQPLARAGDYDLIVVATSFPTSEPIVMMARAGLTECIGTVPLLIISERAFIREPKTRICHLDFPFSSDMLYNAIRAALHEGPVDASDQSTGPYPGAADHLNGSRFADQPAT